MMEPPEASSIKSLLHIARILALIFGILFFLGGLAYTALAIAAYNSCSALVGSYCNGLGFVLIFPIFIILWGVFDVLIYLKLKSISAMVDQRQYGEAKSATLLWMIIGFIVGGIIIGIILLVAWFKYDAAINAQRGGYAPAAPGYYAPATPMMPAPPAAAPTTAPICPRCQKPGTWIAQYQRYYCYTDGQYL